MKPRYDGHGRLLAGGTGSGRAGRERGEDELVHWLRRTLWAGGHLLGDDAAILGNDPEWALSVDSQIEGTHFPAGLDPAIVARRLLAVNLSDMAAMGTRGTFAMLALAAPAGFDHRRFLRAFVAAVKHRVVLIGGDLARAPVLVASLTIIGFRSPNRNWLRRENGRAGDALWVGGTLGESALGRLLLARGATVAASSSGTLTMRGVRLPAALRLRRALQPAARNAVVRHLAPVPQLEIGSELARRRRCAAMDVSDGLARDLSRLCAESGTGATVDADALPLAPHTAELAGALGADPLALALGGGEDYVLLFALPRRAAAPAGCVRIGTLDAAPGMRLRRGETVEPLAPRGWDHIG